MQEYGFALGIYATAARFGTIANNYITVAMASYIGYASLIGLVLLILSAIGGFIFVWLENYAIGLESSGSLSQLQFNETFYLRSVLKFNPQFWLVCVNISLGYIGFLYFGDHSSKFICMKYDL